MDDKKRKEKIIKIAILKGLISAILVCLFLLISNKANNSTDIIISIVFTIILIITNFLINYKFKEMKKEYIKINLLSIPFYIGESIALLLITGEFIGTYNSGMFFLAKVFLDFIIIPVLFIINLIIDLISKKVFKDN